jgi:hypothetical protein
MALSTGHISASLGRPPGLAAGIKGSSSTQEFLGEITGVNFTHGSQWRCIYVFTAYALRAFFTQLPTFQTSS